MSLATLLCPCLIGRVRGQPLPGDRPNIRTNQLIAFDTEQGSTRHRWTFGATECATNSKPDVVVPLKVRHPHVCDGSQ